MPPHDSSKPPIRGDAPGGAGAAPSVQKLTTVTGVTVVASDRRLPSVLARRAPAAAPPPPPVVVRPPPEAVTARDAQLARFAAEYGVFIEKMLLARKDVVAESTKDLRQEVLLVLRDHVDPENVPVNMEGFIVEVIRHQVCNHRCLWKPNVDRGADANTKADSAPDPERIAMVAEMQARLRRYIDALSPMEQEVVRCLDFAGMTLKETAAKLQCPVGTVATAHLRALEKLKELARASDRATACGQRRRPPR